jgi:hypothetical protein
MESEQIPQGVGTPHIPPTLLTKVQQRLARREASVNAHSPLSELLKGLGDPRWEIRAAAARMLGEQEGNARIEPLRHALQDEHRLVRAAVVRALGKCNAPLDQLLLTLHDPDWEVREMTILALAEQQDPAAHSLILAALQDEHSCVREAASVSLAQQPMYSPSPTAEMQKLRVAEQHAVYSSSPNASSNPNASTTIAQTGNKRAVYNHTGRAIRHLWHVFSRQFAIINKSVWLGTPVLLLLWCLKTIFFADSQTDVHRLQIELALLVTVIAAASTAFLYGSGNDNAFELTLATPTSIRIVMLCRFVQVMLYNILWAALASVFIALTHGANWWDFVQLWLGPMLLTASLTLSLSLLISSWLSLLGGIILEFTQSLTFNTHMGTLALTGSSHWQTTPTMLLLTLFCLALALFYAPRQPQLNH